MKNIKYLLIILLLSSCFKEEDKLSLNPAETESMVLGEDYGNVFYYNLASKSVVSENHWSEWNLAFYSQEGDYHIRLNDAANMKAFNAQTTNFESVTSLKPEWRSIVDDAKGSRDNLALKFETLKTIDDTTFYKPNVYVLLLGTNPSGDEIGYKKMTLLYTYSNKYKIRYSNLDNTESYEYIITKDAVVNFIHFSFANKGNQVIIEPDKTTWDVVFTRSTDITITNDFVDTIFDYSVTSVLLNPLFTKAYEETEINYDDISIKDIKYQKLTNQLNIIGFEFKSFNLTTGYYTIKPNKSYVIKDINDFYYKIKFVGFYDPNTNIKGTISFVYEIIK